MQRFSAAAICLAMSIASPALGEEHLLLELIPANLDGVTAVAAVRDALLYRGWVVTSSSDNAVSAEIKSGKEEAKIAVRAAGGKVVYTLTDFAGQDAYNQARLRNFVGHVREDATYTLRIVSLAVDAMSRGRPASR